MKKLAQIKEIFLKLDPSLESEEVVEKFREIKFKGRCAQ